MYCACSASTWALLDYRQLPALNCKYAATPRNSQKGDHTTTHPWRRVIGQKQQNDDLPNEPPPPRNEDATRQRWLASQNPDENHTPASAGACPRQNESYEHNPPKPQPTKPAPDRLPDETQDRKPRRKTIKHRRNHTPTLVGCVVPSLRENPPDKDTTSPQYVQPPKPRVPPPETTIDETVCHTPASAGVWSLPYVKTHPTTIWTSPQYTSQCAATQASSAHPPNMMIDEIAYHTPTAVGCTKAPKEQQKLLFWCFLCFFIYF
ncbi:hypothetical protein BS47DRAFT_1358164 [Hydnum rufescens UP504]|uniref:Uncharacterized protein n=1 Tax=Hydnum rufescens UP504 TaxID=1448309 RepID=A0A9P6B8H7_9AGAM|nr:hypothetical protein BS47DRAFT_1358164 [Hydnum rufescens UP504]